jgi:hypothetical protein
MRYTFKDIDNIIKQLKEFKLSFDSLPGNIRKYQNEITQILIIPTLDEESCCGSGCSPCVKESAVDNEILYKGKIESLLIKLNKLI